MLASYITNRLQCSFPCNRIYAWSNTTIHYICTYSVMCLRFWKVAHIRRLFLWLTVMFSTYLFQKWYITVFESNIIFTGLRSVLEGCVLTMFSGLCEQEVQSLVRQVDGSNVLFAQARVHCGKTWQMGFATIRTWHFQFDPLIVSVLHSKGECGARSESRFACFSHCHATWCPINDGNCLLTMQLNGYSAFYNLNVNRTKKQHFVWV